MIGPNQLHLFSPVSAILPGDVGFGPLFLALVFVVISLGVIATLVAIVWSNKHPSETNWKGMEKKEGWYSIIFLIVVIVFATSTLGLLPYPYAHGNIQASVVIDVRAQQFQWCLSYYPNWGTACQADIQVPANEPILFNTSSIDVNHGFGLYAANGQLLDQVQVMPGFYNDILYQFATPERTMYVVWNSAAMATLGWYHSST